MQTLGISCHGLYTFGIAHIHLVYEFYIMVSNANTPVEGVDAPSTQGLNKLGLELAVVLKHCIRQLAAMVQW